MGVVFKKVPFPLKRSVRRKETKYGPRKGRKPAGRISSIVR